MLGELIAGRFELEQIVGSGGMATVYRAHDRLLERTVAIKILHEQFARDEDAVARFRREARAVAQLTHPSIVTVIDRGEEDGRPYIVFEYVEGETLKQLLLREGALPVERALETALEIARALEAAHRRGLLHRDVKPQNVLLAEDGRAKVTDFGIARARGADGLTITGTVLGTSDYIPPEQARGEPTGAPADVYSLGAVLYELLTGEVPYEGDNPVTVAMRHVRDPVPSVRNHRRDVPERVDGLVRRALAKDPADRFASMSEVIAELEACLAGRAVADSEATMVLPPGAPVARARRGRRVARRLAVSLVSLALVAAAAVGAYVLVRGVESAADDRNGRQAGQAVGLTAVASYDPEGGDGEHGERVADATDGNASTYWPTEQYFSGLNKDGVGLVLDAGRQSAVTHVTLTTDTPGFRAEIHAGASAAGPFEPVSDNRAVERSTSFRLREGPERYYVVWITDLGGGQVAHVNEVRARSA
ncbi:MAG: serine/threonine protein kinase [Thermoleophilia bacterium]|nr:serine/threonine protein kinase [Thermoleophilia bacterium]